MIKIFKWQIATKDEINAINERIDGIVASTTETSKKQGRQLSDFSEKFDTSMDFIGRNLPLKRKRKAFFKIVK